MRIATFEAKCTKLSCKHVFEAPLLSNFSYGEFLYSSVDSEEIRYYCGLDCSTWSFVDEFVSATFIGKNRSEIGTIIQKIIGFIADKQNSNNYFTQDIYCPKCNSIVKSINVNNKTGIEKYKSLTFNSFSRLTEVEKKELIERYLNDFKEANKEGLDSLNNNDANDDLELRKSEKISLVELSESEIKILEQKYVDGITKVKKFSIITLIFSIIALILPTKIWNILIIPRKQLHDLPDIAEPMYLNITMIIILTTIVILTPIVTYYAFVHLVKKDLRFKVKICGLFKVVRIENLSKRVAQKLDGLDTVLHFEKNKTKINRHLFNKSKKPELLDANAIYVECSKYSMTIFKEEIQSN